jgi:hypothetical protein
MHLRSQDLRVGQRFIFKGQNARIVNIDDSVSDRVIFYEYFTRGDFVHVDHCPAKVFCHHAIWDLPNDPEFKDISSFLLSEKVEEPLATAGLLQKKITFNGKIITVKNAVVSLVEMGYRPAKRNTATGLYREGVFIPTEHLSKTGMKLARHLCREKGWDGRSIGLPDMVVQ